jgi:hypothetical protein
MTGFARYWRRPRAASVPNQKAAGTADDAPAPAVAPASTDETSGLTAWQASRWAEIQGGSPHCLIGHDRERADMVAGLRALANFLEANPAVPIPRNGHEFGVSTSGSDEQKRSQVKFAGLAIGEDVTDNAEGTHCSARRRFGPVSYHIFAVSGAHLQRYQQAVSSLREAGQETDRFAGPEDDH